MGAILVRAVVSMLIGAAVLLAQGAEQNPDRATQAALILPATADRSDLDDPIVPTVADPPVAVAYFPLTLGQKYTYALSAIFGPDRLVGMLGYSAFKQSRDLPVQWGTRPSAYAVRFASQFGNIFVNHALTFSIGALDHEDPRYVRSDHGNLFARVGHAVVHTFVVHNDRGGWMPAYSIVASDVATPFLARRWEPEQFQTAATLQTGAINIGLDIGNSLLKEFYPDLRRAFPKWLTRNNPLLPATVD